MSALGEMRTALEPMLWAELLDERTPSARIWQHQFNPRRRYCVVRMSTHCFASPGSDYLDKVIDYRLGWTAKGWRPHASPFPVTIARKGEHISIAGIELELVDFGMFRAGLWWSLLCVSSDKLSITPRSAPYRVEPTWHASYIHGQIAPGVGFHAAISARGYGKELRFSPLVQQQYFRALTDAEHFGFRYRIKGELAAGWCMTTPRMFVRRRGGRAEGFYRQQGEFLYALFPRRHLDRLLPGEWIVDPAITQESIVANSDDCYDDNNSGSNNLSGYNGSDYSGTYGSQPLGTGLRFDTIPIPADATGMNSASVQVFRENISGTPDLIITADDVDNAGTWTAGVTTNRPQGSGFTPTTANVLWNAGFGPGNSVYITTPDLAAVVDEVIQRAGWANNNAIRFRIIRNVTTGGLWLAVNDFNNNSTTEEALFDADYIAAAGGVRTGTLTQLGVGR